MISSMMSQESVMEIQIWIINHHEWNMDFYKSFMIIEHSYALTYFQNSRTMEIHGTNDDSWHGVWNDKRITKNL